MLIRWVQEWRERRRLRGRGLFRYSDGQRTRYADPAMLWRKLLNDPRLDFTVDIPLADQGKEPEASKVNKILCEIFDVEPWSDCTRRGLTTWEVLSLVREFDAYIDALKKNISPSQMPLQLSAYEYSTSPDLPESPTNSTAVSSPTTAGSNCDEGSASCEPSRTL